MILRKPITTYITQGFYEWISWFYPQVEELIDDWKIKNQSHGSSISNYQQSPSWKHLYPNSQTSKVTSTLLLFSLFIDWFDLLTNKLAGKQVLVGVVALNCLNLPPSTRWKLQNTFVAGMIPPPNEPNPITIHDIPIPLVKNLIKLKSGIKICTPKSPNGHNVVVKLGCLMGNLVATHKGTGFTSHSENMFCNWCECTKSEIGNLKVGRFCKGRIVQDYSNAFKMQRLRPKLIV
ncbi:hypothetical protein O181_091937 [Austropuccinia psidii MF-1]|uniref:Uncharacterized protein n=1 Tax=Austropuccinia psidii MF-1 TaxID=1389203 RepID=A0A9Q3IY73_9BASI|nr:hypothetical protein [Austropuccinia psidii MF-1]